ncbi:protein rep [Alkalibacillus almallahensis]|uniref:protein rep n=1 Tax=Alkalibacillus almallahensis TaxID=1379154 RepID=UPI001420D91B|nr:protein rep [Alkalibacillus almallahensis]NIK13476.1 plasmid rolling circle replication initiator protein Rep [Alkalibacillus almallahensis]
MDKSNINVVEDKYTPKKQKNLVLSGMIENLVSESMYELIVDCNTFMMMASDKNMEHKKLYKNNACKNRFCPICAWRKAGKDALKLSIMMKHLKSEQDKQLIFATFTTPNVKADELNDEIRHLNQSFQRLMQRKQVRETIQGYARKIEVTYNQERDDYNPHIHALFVVDKGYFNNPKKYMPRDRWLELWKSCTKDERITQVHVQKVREDNNSRAYEVAKYSAKDEDYLISEEVFKVFYKALKGKRLIVFSGLFKEASQKYEDGELDHLKEESTIDYVYLLMYQWGNGKYAEIEKRLLDDEEKEEVNGGKIEDMEVE